MHTKNWSTRSQTVFPGGSLGEYNLPPDLTVVLTNGKGSKVYDTAGREYVDYTMGWGSLLLGHAPEAVVTAVTRQAARGSNFAYVTQPAVELAEEMVRAIPCAEKVRFCAS
ncbi:MAG: aminotransferase class III-fold pyridoxal phosphate-dependent enzyme, partial [Anaerolineae bacterium]